MLSFDKTVTVFTSSYSHGKYLSKCIQSVLKQTFTDFEYILIDDGSEDNTLDVMYKYSKLDDRIKVVEMEKQPTKGPLINKSVSISTGKYWVWAPADDILHVDLLSKKMAFLKEVGVNSIIYSDYWFINKDDALTGESKLIKYTPETLVKAIWKTTNLIGFTGIWIPMWILKNTPFPEHIKYSEDFYWLLQTLLMGHKYYHLQDKLYYKRKHSESVTSMNYKAVIEDVDNIRNEIKIQFGLNQ